MPETSYASCGDLSLAYQVFGDGPVELVFAGSFVSHVELFWTLPEFEAFMDQLAHVLSRRSCSTRPEWDCRIRFRKVRTLDDRAAEIEAVMDAAGFQKAASMGVSEGGPAAMVFAATRPERTRALILTGTTAYTGVGEWDDFDRDPAELRARGVLGELGENYAPSVEQFATRSGIRRATSARRGAAAPHSSHSSRRSRQYASSECWSA